MMVLQILNLAASSAAVLLVLNLSFRAGRLVQQVEDLEQRVTRLDLHGCGKAADCPMRGNE
jgi:hypothetical protein